MNLVVYLESSITAFNADANHISNLKKSIPQLSIYHVENEQDFFDRLTNADFVIVWRFKRDWYEKAPQLKAIFTPAAGKEWIEVSPHTHVPVFHGAFHGIIMAESVLAMMLYFNRRIYDIVNLKKEAKWERDSFSSSTILGSQNVLLIGYGSIARHCARLLKPFGCTIIGVKRSGRKAFADRGADKIVKWEDVTPYLADADHVIAILPSESSTDKLIKREHFMAMKPTAYFYNIGRGNCVSEDDLLWALQNKIAGAGLDVFEEEPLDQSSKLWGLPNILIYPHATAICKEYLPLFFNEVQERLKAFF